MAVSRRITVGKQPLASGSGIAEQGSFNYQTQSMTISEVPLKPDIWIEVFRCLKDSDRTSPGPGRQSEVIWLSEQIKSLCLTCQLFREIAQPLLFEELKFHGEDASLLLKKVRHQQDLFRSIPGSPNWIKSITIALWNVANIGREPPSREAGEASKILSEILFPQMTRLRHINIVHTVISAGMYTRLYQLPTLKFLQLWNVSFYGDPVTSNLRVEDLALQNVVFKDFHTEKEEVKAAAARLAFSPVLETLHLSPTIAPTVFKLVTSLDFKSLDHLCSLSLTEPRDTLLLDFFEFARFCPNITTIATLPNRTPDLQSKPPTVPSDILTNLSSLKCSPSLAESLVRGRNITNLTCETVGHAGQRLSVIERIIGRTPQLQSLTLRWTIWSEDLFRVLSTSVPDLQSLGLWIIDDAYTVSSSLDDSCNPDKDVRHRRG